MAFSQPTSVPHCHEWISTDTWQNQIRQELPHKDSLAVDNDTAEIQMDEEQTKKYPKKSQKMGGGIPSLKKYCQRENDRNNYSEIENTRRRKEEQRKSERKGR